MGNLLVEVSRAQTFCSRTAVPRVMLLGHFRRVQGDTEGDGLGWVGESIHCSRGVHLQRSRGACHG